MYELRPPAVYAHESVVADPRYKARLDREIPPDRTADRARKLAAGVEEFLA